MKKVLIITYYFNQKNEVGSIRLRGLAKYLHKFGWEPTILTVKSFQEPDPQFKIVETDYIDLRGKWKKKFNLNPNQSINEQISSTKKMEEVSQII